MCRIYYGQDVICNALVLSNTLVQERTIRLLICMTCPHFSATCLRPFKTAMLVVLLTRYCDQLLISSALTYFLTSCYFKINESIERPYNEDGSYD